MRWYTAGFEPLAKVCPNLSCLEVSKHMQFDEMWHFLQQKKKKAVGHQSR
jgi:hypothetical protein